MKSPLISDLRGDTRLVRNLVRIVAFLLLFILLDNIVSRAILKGINRNYGLKEDTEILMIGHSHLMLAIDKVFLEDKTGLSVAKYTREGVNIADRRVMLEHYFNTCPVKPEIVIIGIDPWLFTGEGLSTNSYLLFLPFMDDPEVRKYIKGSAIDYFDYLLPALVRNTRFNATLLNASIRGYLGNWSNLKNGIIDSVRIRKEISGGSFRKITFDKELTHEFSTLLDNLAGENVKVLLLNTPVWKPLVAAQSEEYTKSMQIIDSLAQNHCPSAVLIDLVPRFSHKSSYFFDPIHLNPEGQRIVTVFVSRVVDSMMVERKW